jgi:hypothetical protein
MKEEFKQRVRPYIVQLKELLVSFLGVSFSNFNLVEGFFLTRVSTLMAFSFTLSRCRLLSGPHATRAKSG